MAACDPGMVEADMRTLLSAAQGDFAALLARGIPHVAWSQPGTPAAAARSIGQGLARLQDWTQGVHFRGFRRAEPQRPTWRSFPRRCAPMPAWHGTDYAKHVQSLPAAEGQPALARRRA